VLIGAMSCPTPSPSLTPRKAAAGAALAEVEAVARREIDGEVLWVGEPGEMDLPPSGFHFFQMPDGQEYIALFDGPDAVEIDAVERHGSIGRIEDKAAWLGETGEITIPVPATKR
jgi:hypothetical protein